MKVILLDDSSTGRGFYQVHDYEDGMAPLTFEVPVIRTEPWHFEPLPISSGPLYQRLAFDLVAYDDARKTAVYRRRA